MADALSGTVLDFSIRLSRTAVTPQHRCSSMKPKPPELPVSSPLALPSFTLRHSDSPPIRQVGANPIPLSEGTLIAINLCVDMSLQAHHRGER